MARTPRINKMKIFVFSIGDYICGVFHYTNYLIKALNMVGFETELVTPKTMSDLDVGDSDIILLTNIGWANEMSNKGQAEISKKRLEVLDKYYGKVPFVLVVHDIAGRLFFKRSYEYFDDKTFDLIVSVEDSDDMFTFIVQTSKFKDLVYIGHLFEFDDENFKDKSQYHKRIVNSARIGSSKKTNVVFEIARELEGKRKIFVTGEEQGTYWYFGLREHPDKKYVEFTGEYTDFREIYKDVAFGMDLSWFRKGNLLSRSRTQYTVIEAVDCGVIPIGFDVWRSENGYEGIWLPSPKKEGRRTIFDAKKYAEIIGNFEYDFDMAKRNREFLKKHCDPRTVGERFKHFLDKL